MDANETRWIELLTERGLATPEQIEEAQKVRAQVLEMGMRDRSIADVLHEQEVLDDAALADLEREMRHAQGKEQIAGYRLLEPLGEGAMGTVYKARQLSLDRDVAIKVLNPDLADDEAHVRRFMTEARAVARLNHTNIISGIDVGDVGGIQYLVMEFADGMTVASLLERGGAIDEERSLVIGLQIARALDHAHRNDLIHRDVKPDNVILTKEGIAKLCDLGLARTDLEEPGSTGRMGTADYISPEQAQGASDVTERTDLYSLGATLFHMMTGRPPYEGGDASSVLAQHLTAPVPSVLEHDPALSEGTDILLQHLMAKDPAERIGAARDVADAIDARVRELQEERGVSASALGPSGASSSAPATRSAPSAPGAPSPRRRRRRR